MKVLTIYSVTVASLQSASTRELVCVGQSVHECKEKAETHYGLGFEKIMAEGRSYEVAGAI